jgi:hypothetical protein
MTRQGRNNPSRKILVIGDIGIQERGVISRLIVCCRVTIRVQKLRRNRTTSESRVFVALENPDTPEVKDIRECDWHRVGNLDIHIADIRV